MTPTERGKSGAVIAAFPATGKTFIAGRDHRFADSDSSQFSWAEPGVRHPEWPGNYMAHIAGLVESGTHVLCSTHQEVRDALVAARIPFTLAYPSIDQRAAYIERLEQRGSPESLIAFVTANWDDLISSCIRQRGCDHIVLPRGFHLSNVIQRAVRADAA